MRTFAINTILTLAVTSLAVADDWPNFRGPNHDGVSSETGLRTTFDGPLKLVWDRDVGDSFSSFAAVGGKLYTCGTQDDQQVLLCLDAASGKVLWQTPIEKEYKESMGGDGTRATPTVDEGRVYVLGALGRWLCCDASDGRILWEHRFSNPPTWGYSGSVLIEGNLAIASGGKSDGGLVALDKQTGKPVWKTGDDLVGYATPYPFTFEGSRYVVGFMGQSAMIVDAKTGKQVWEMSWKTSYDVNAAAPLFHDGQLLLSSGYRHGAILQKLRKDGTKLALDKVWEDKVLRNKFQSYVLLDGYLYTSDEKDLKCVELATGELKWSYGRTAKRAKHGTLVLADGNLFVLTEHGRLLIGPASPDGFTPTTDAEILGGRCWSVPVIYDGKLYARNLSRIVCFDIKE